VDHGIDGPQSPASDNDFSQDYGTQPMTQPLDLLDGSNVDQSMELSQDEWEGPQIWGVLYPLRDAWRAACLSVDNVSMGRSSGCTFTIDRDQAGDRIVSISKVHFEIKRTADGVKITDKSSNGTFVNKKPIGKGKSRLLEHNAEIGLADAKRSVFIYMSTNKDFQRDYPKELRSKYLISKELGSGACGVVRLGFKIAGGSATKDNPQRVAVKKVDKKNVPVNRGSTSDVLNEVRILKAIDHPCVIRLEDVVDTEQYLYIILELADGGELFDKIVEKTKLDEDEAKLMFYQLASAISYLHSKNIAHRDLKPENILLCSDDDKKPLCKITDMGLSKLVDLEAQSKLKTFCGTPQYLAPEVLTSRIRGDGSYGFEVDNWSLGVILYVMVSGMPPFSPDRQDKQLIRQVCDGDYSFTQSRWHSVSQEAKDLISGLMTVNKHKRLTAQQALEHPWLQNEATRLKAEELMQWSLSMRPNRGWPGEDSIVGRLSQDLASRNLMPPPLAGGPSAPSAALAAATLKDEAQPVPIITEPAKRLRRSSTEETPESPGVDSADADGRVETIEPPPAKKICV